MSSKQPNETTALAQDRKILASVDKYFATIATLMIAGTTYTPASLKAVFQAHIDSLTAIGALRAQLAKLVDANRLMGANAHAMTVALRTYILGNYGPRAVDMLKDFGMKVPASKGATVKTKAQALVKAKATRTARHTLGKKQKSTIKGTLPEENLQTIVTPKPTA